MCKEVGNTKDRYAIAILRETDLVEQLAQKISIPDISGGCNITQDALITWQMSHGFNYCERIQPQK